MALTRRRARALKEESRAAEHSESDLDSNVDDADLVDDDSLSLLNGNNGEASQIAKGGSRKVYKRRLTGNASFRVVDDPIKSQGLLFQEKPRQVIFLCVILLGLAYIAYSHDADTKEDNIKAAVAAAAMVFLIYSLLMTRDSVMVRPHPGVWRLIHGAGTLYLLFLSALAATSKEGAIEFFKIFFPEVGEESGPPIYAHRDCSINYETISDAVYNLWFLAHAVGWWGKMCMFRDWKFCWVLSISFELLEMSLQFVIPDFKECWWDCLLVDTFGANVLGMVLGKLTLSFLETKSYDWSGKRSQVSRTLNQFTPFSWSKYKWEVFSSLPRLFMVCVALVVTLMVELNAFFVMFTLGIPKTSNFHKYRLGCVFLLALSAAAEYYEFVTDKYPSRLGQNAWLIVGLMSVELLVWVKFIDWEYVQSPPADVAVPWICSLVLFATWVILFYGGFLKHKSNRSLRNFLDGLYWFSFVPLLYLVKQWAY